MAEADWERIGADDFRVPPDRPLAELTEELTAMLGATDPQVRDSTAYATLATWVGRGVYDDRLSGLGDGMAAGLQVGIGAIDDDSVFRRSFSALVLAECIERDNGRPLVLGGKVLQWGDALSTWLLRERDLRGFVPGKGWAHAVAHGADALAALARSPHLGPPELTVVLDVVADRLLTPSPTLLTHGEPDRLARTTLAVLRRNSVPMSVLEPWINRLASIAGPTATRDGADPYVSGGDAQAFLRALYLQLALGSRPPTTRADVMLVLVGALRGSNPMWG